MLNSEEISVNKIKSGIGGYKKKATQEFVETIRNDYEALYKENLELKDKLAVLSEGVQYYKNMEKSLQKALVLAERTTSETMHAAEVKAVAMEKEAKARADIVKKEAKIEAENCEKEAAAKAERIIREAKEQADTAIAEGNEELRRIHSQIMNLIQQYEQYKAQYKQLALAQMNVLESEAYNLDAPILKTIQYAVEQGERTDTKKKPQEEMQQDEVVQPVPVKQEHSFAKPEQQNGKKVYVDARGEVVEVHEFREVTIPHTGVDPFKDEEEDSQDDMDFFQFNKDKGVERFDDDDTLASDLNNIADVFDKTKTSDNIVGISKLQGNVESDTQASVQTFNFIDKEENNGLVSDIDKLSAENIHNVMFNAMKNENASPVLNEYEKSEESKDYSKESDLIEENMKNVSSAAPGGRPQMSAAAMREIEKMQLERLRQEEEEHTKALQQAQDRKAYFTMGNGANVPNEQLKSKDDFAQNVTFGNEKTENDFAQNIAFDNKETENDFAQNITFGNEKMENDFYQNVTFGNEKPEISLHDIKMQEEEQNKHVPLPKASEDNLYFPESANRVDVLDGKENISGENNGSVSFYSKEQQVDMERFVDVDSRANAMRAADIADEMFHQQKEDENTFFNQVMNSKNETGSFFEQFSNQTTEDVREVHNDESKNSLDFELDFNNGMPTAHNRESGFKSFRDFESEL